jgi:thiosulfate dehydrogenase (quinone) large subunit
MSTSTHNAEIAVVDDPITTTAGQKWSGVVRILLGFTFLWAFLDKTFGWGYSTTDGWLFGTGKGNPTAGFLKFGVNPNGPFHTFYTNLAPSSPGGIVNWLFMGALLGAGITLVFGVAMRIGCIGSALLLISMFLAVAPWAKYEDKGGSTVASNNPLLDEHIIYAATLMVLMFIRAGRYWGLGRWWESKTPSWLH